MKLKSLGAVSEYIPLSLEPRLNLQEMAAERGGHSHFLVYPSHTTLATKSS